MSDGCAYIKCSADKLSGPHALPNSRFLTALSTCSTNNHAINSSEAESSVTRDGPVGESSADLGL